MQQIILNFDASEFDAFERTQEFFSHATRTLKDEQGRTVKQCVQAMEVDLAPTQWNQKLNETNNTSVTLNDADKYTEFSGDSRWIEFAYWKHVIKKKKNRTQLLKLKEQIERELEAAE